MSAGQEVLDATALIAFLRREPGWEGVAETLADQRCYAHALNLCEVFYDTRRASDEATAQKALADLYAVGVIPQEDMDATFWQEVGRLKADHRRVSLADCCCLALARRLGAEVLTADHHDFDALVPLGLCPIRFIR